MKIQVINDLGESFTQVDCPSPVMHKIIAAPKHRRSGVVYSGGLLWQWRIEPERDYVPLEFTQADQVVKSFRVDRLFWEGFTLVAERNGYDDPKNYLTFILSTCMAEGDSLEQILEWLFYIPAAPSTKGDA